MMMSSFAPLAKAKSIGPLVPQTSIQRPACLLAGATAKRLVAATNEHDGPKREKSDYIPTLSRAGSVSKPLTSHGRSSDFENDYASFATFAHGCSMDINFG